MKPCLVMKLMTHSKTHKHNLNQTSNSPFLKECLITRDST